MRCRTFLRSRNNRAHVRPFTNATEAEVGAKAQAHQGEALMFFLGVLVGTTGIIVLTFLIIVAVILFTDPGVQAYLMERKHGLVRASRWSGSLMAALQESAAAQALPRCGAGWP